MNPMSFLFAPSLSPRRGLLVALMLAVTAAAPDTRADDLANAQKSSQLVYRQANDAFLQRKYDESRGLLLGLWEKSHTYDVAVLLTQDEIQLGHYAAAATYLEFAIASIPPGEKLSAAEELRKNLADLRTRTARAKIVTDQPSADLLVDGQSVGTSPLDSEVYLDPGHHVIEATLGERKATEAVDASAGGVVAVELKLGPTVRQLPFPDPDPKPNEGPEKKNAPTTKFVVAGVGAALTVVAFAIGEGYAIGARSKQSDVDRLKAQVQTQLGGNCFSSSSSPACGDLDRARTDRNSDNQVARAAFIASGVLAVGTVATFLLWPANTSSQARITPRFDRTGGALTVQGAF
jgi:hypothetical protein